MNIFRKDNLKLMLAISSVICIFCIILVATISRNEYIKYNEIVNTKIDFIINNVIKDYPDIDEQDIIDILNNEENTQKYNVLDKYGYSDESIYIKQLEDNMNKSIIINICILILFICLLILPLFIYIRNRDKKINEIKEYIKAINNKDYTLNIEDNGESEISKLRNELYKITISLKETAEINKFEKEQLSNSLADISHQLKTPLTSIRIMLDNIEENPNMDENTRQEFMQEISKQIDWINSLVISLLKLAKFDAGAIVMNKQKIKVNELITNVVNNLSILIEVKNTEIVQNIPEDSCFIGDYKWELEALTNIVKNAIEHCNENSKIYINVENNSLFLKISIKDEGEGIDKNDLKHIFDRFYKSKNASENSIGIGLSLAKTIIEKDNGYIDVESNINKGTLFEIKYIKN